MAWTTIKGFNFRDTLAFDTDGTNEVAIIGNGSGSIAAGSVYPRSVTIDGDTFNVGWDTATGDGARDRWAPFDARLAGTHMVPNNQAGGRTFRINVPAGVIELTLAMGDADGGRAIYWQVLNDASVLETFDYTGSTTGNSDFYDASGNLHLSDAAWLASQTPKQYTISSGILNIRTGKGSGSESSAVAHIGVRSISSSTIVNRESTRRGVARGVLRGV